MQAVPLPGHTSVANIPCLQQCSYWSFYLSRRRLGFSGRLSSARLNLSPSLHSLFCRLCQSQDCQPQLCQRLDFDRQSSRPCTVRQAWSCGRRARKSSLKGGSQHAGAQWNCCSKGQRRPVSERVSQSSLEPQKEGWRGRQPCAGCCPAVRRTSLQYGSGQA